MVVLSKVLTTLLIQIILMVNVPILSIHVLEEIL